RWRATREILSRTRAELESATADVTELTAQTSRLSAVQAEAAAGLPEMRGAEAEAAARLQRLTLARDGLEAEDARLAETRAGFEARRSQIVSDRAREDTLATDAARALERLIAEETALDTATAEETKTLAAAEESLTAAVTAADGDETEVARLTESVVAAEARRATTVRDIEAFDTRMGRLRDDAAEVAARPHKIEGEEDATEDAIADAEKRLAAARAEAERRREAEAEIEARRGDTLSAELKARDVLQEAQSALAEPRAEESALAAVLAEGEGDLWPPLIDAVSVAPGFETALGAALGDDLAASEAAQAPVHWRALPPLVDRPLPNGAAPLADHVKGPARLARRLSQIGIVPDEDTGHRLHDALEPGQRLVTPEGALWRWDGFVMGAGAPAAAANRLRQRNRLVEIRTELPALEDRVNAARESFETARTAASTAAETEQATREAGRRAEAALDTAREEQTGLAQTRAAIVTRRQALKDATARLAAELADCETRISEARTTLAQLPAAEDGRQALEDRRRGLQEKRAALTETRSERDRLRREVETRRRRVQAIADERASWQKRAEGARGQLEQLAARDADIEAELARLARIPDEIAAKRSKLFAEVETAEAARQTQADRLAEAEARLAETDRALKAAEEKLTSAREARARNEGLLAQAEQSNQAVAERAAERLDRAPEDLAELAGIAPDASEPEAEAAERKLERLQRERANMGPVNLRADVEAEEQRKKIASLDTEREDLIAAIAKLRAGIKTLNREGRQRLLSAFEEVDRHFQELFQRLFGGGRAHLALTESEDPLEAGLEIMAQPPGKKLQTLSLLSGGEKALTALALLFAVFLTNPAPICVLDEV
ncbi:MAG: chromosome partitioning protein ParA, partial [Alphaproteobacteria bacterium]